MSEFAEYPKAVGSHLALNAEHEAAILKQYYPKPKAAKSKKAGDGDGKGDDGDGDDDAKGSGDGEGKESA